MASTAAPRPFEFRSDGAVLRGRLYLPERVPAPIMIMAHGFSATIPMVMDRYAERFRDAGVAALAFDHRGHGTSEGEPRGEINVWVQARGYLDALDAVRNLAEVDPSAVALWSDSMSARVALGVAALDDRVAALICQVPALGDVAGRDDPGGNRLDIIRQFLAAGNVRRPQDAWQSMAVVSSDQVAAPSALRPLTAFRWFIEHGGRYGSGWTNRVVFTARKDAPDFDPFACAPMVRVPVMFVMSPDDEMEGADSGVARGVFDRLPGSTELLEVDGGHFGIIEHPSEAFERASMAQAAWLARVLA